MITAGCFFSILYLVFNNKTTKENELIIEKVLSDSEEEFPFHLDEDYAPDLGEDENKI
jgi:hypothetical protein